MRRLICVISCLLLAELSARAQDATWAGTTSDDWNTGSNWSTTTVPTGTATFGTSNVTSITFQLQIDSTQTPPNIITPPPSIQLVDFGSNAPAYTFTLSAPYRPHNVLTIAGTGIVNNSSAQQLFKTVSGGTLAFANSSSAGNVTIVNSNFGLTLFNDSSTAASSTITNTDFASTQFSGTSTAGNATINNTQAGTAREAFTWFVDSSTAGNAKISNSSGGATFFSSSNGQSTAGSATIINLAGGLTEFLAYSDAGNATIENSNGGVLNFMEPNSGQFGPSAANATIINNLNGITNFYSASQTCNNYHQQWREDKFF